MGNKNKHKHKNKNIQSSQNNNVFDVKTNLRKLQSGNGKTTHSSTEYDFIVKNKEGVYTNDMDSSFYDIHKTYDKFDSLTNKINTDISGLKDYFNSVKDSINNNIKSEVSALKGECDTKIDKKIDTLYFTAAIGVLLLVASIIYTLSYSELIQDSKNFKDDNRVLNDSIRSLDRRVKNLELKK